MDPDHESLSAIIEQHRTLAAHRLGHQRLLSGDTGSQVHHCGVELHELHVGHHGPRTHSQSDAVAGRDTGVRRRGEDLADPTGGQHHRRGQDRPDPVDLPLTHHVQRDALRGSRLVLQKIQHQRVLDDLDPLSDFGHQSAQDLGASGVPAGMGDAVGQMTAFPGQCDVAGGCAVELGSPTNQSADRGRAGFHEHSHRGRITQTSTGDQRVLHVFVRGVLGPEGCGDPTLRPSGRTLVHLCLRDHYHFASRPGGTDGCGEAGDAGTHDHHIGVDEPSGRGGSQRVGEDHRPVTSTAQLSISRVAPTRTATSSRPRPMRGGPSSGSRTTT